ncbi:MAG: class I SAM-dependent methyltransferase [Burkholderiaceae bacterium]|nr:class I SAM-dependent methyltransferase [Burkholderiaceae bacterium]
MSGLVATIDRALYPAFDRNWDDALFRERILARIDRNSVVLDLGAGAGIVREMYFKGHASKVCGVDLDERVETNPMLDEGKVSDAGRIPYPDETFDIVFADNVMEHIAEPLAVLAEVRRVLKPGGVFLFKTPNKTHYMPTIARLTPHRFHQLVNRLRGRAAVDTFPTLYRANTKRAVQRLAASTGFTVEKIDRIEGRPEYLRISWPTYLLGAAYERLVNGTELLAAFRILLVAELRKQ